MAIFRTRADADGKIELLAKKTGGKSYYINERNANQVDRYFRDALESVLSYQPAISSDNLIVQVDAILHFTQYLC